LLPLGKFLMEVEEAFYKKWIQQLSRFTTGIPG